MTKGQTQVKEFMEAFGQKCPSKPTKLDEETAKLRAKLILEEALETITQGLGLKVILTQAEWLPPVTISEEWLDAIGVRFDKVKEFDLEKLADGLCDLAYVGEFGTAEAAGLDLEPIQDEVHRSNMSKMWTQEDLDEYLVDTNSVIPVGNNRFIVKREDGKIVKSPSHQEANIAPLIEAQLK